MNLLDRAIAIYDPVRALHRAQARMVLAHYEAAKPSKQRKPRRDNSSPNALVGSSATALRAHARFLERNHDICAGALRTLVNSVVGPTGIGVEPQPRRADGSIHEEYAGQLREAHRKWRKKPEVTRKMNDAAQQRMAAYTWFRDGEMFAQQLYGEVPFLRHATDVPYSIELFEPDFVPLSYTDDAKRIRQGIRTSAWGQPTEYYLFRGDPREGSTWLSARDLKAIPADRMLHLATFTRLHQLRGISDFATVLTRIEDLKDYEESERIAAKVAASMTAYVKRAAPQAEGFDPASRIDPDTGQPVPRELAMKPGMIIDSLVAGEEIGMIDSNRPNPNLIGWRAGQLRAFAAGLGTGYSSIARDYSGSYSAQRQELVEQWVNYAVLADEFSGMYVEPSYSRFVQMAHISGVVRIPADVLPGTEDDALFIGQSMPWIDPLKETLAWEKQMQAGITAETEVIRKRGGNPRDTLEQFTAWRKKTAAAGLVFSSNAANSPAVQAAEVWAGNAADASAGNKTDDE